MSGGLSMLELAKLLGGAAFILGVLWIVLRPPGVRRHQSREAEYSEGHGLTRKQRDDDGGWSGGDGGGDGGGD